jgi:hypothetical protein
MNKQETSRRGEKQGRQGKEGRTSSSESEEDTVESLEVVRLDDGVLSLGGGVLSSHRSGAKLARPSWLALWVEEGAKAKGRKRR